MGWTAFAWTPFSNADLLVAKANKPTVKEVHEHIARMSNVALQVLMGELLRNPDSRFGDNLLVALSQYR